MFNIKINSAIDAVELLDKQNNVIVEFMSCYVYQYPEFMPDGMAVPSEYIVIWDEKRAAPIASIKSNFVLSVNEV